jgi:hypothetical protein
VEVMEIAARVTKKHGKGKVVANGTPARGSPVPDMEQGNGAGPDAGFGIMSNVVWAEIGRALMDELGALIFAAGKPAEFKSVSLGMVYEVFLILTLCANRTMQRPRLLYPVWNISHQIYSLLKPCVRTLFMRRSNGGGSCLCTSSFDGGRLSQTWRRPLEKESSGRRWVRAPTPRLAGGWWS